MKLVFVCVGTPKIIGDSVRPRVGSFLKELGFVVYGTLKEPITALNIKEFLSVINEKHKDDLIVGIDAAFGDIKDIRKIKFSKIGIRPGGAYNKKNLSIGDIRLLAIVADRNAPRHTALDVVSEEIINSLYQSLVELATYVNYEFSKKIIKRYLKNYENP